LISNIKNILIKIYRIQELSAQKKVKLVVKNLGHNQLKVPIMPMQRDFKFPNFVYKKHFKISSDASHTRQYLVV